jgi:hypothetical protein
LFAVKHLPIADVNQPVEAVVCRDLSVAFEVGGELVEPRAPTWSQNGSILVLVENLDHLPENASSITGGTRCSSCLV